MTEQISYLFLFLLLTGIAAVLIIPNSVLLLKKRHISGALQTKSLQIQIEMKDLAIVFMSDDSFLGSNLQPQDYETTALTTERCHSCKCE